MRLFTTPHLLLLSVSLFFVCLFCFLYFFNLRFGFQFNEGSLSREFCCTFVKTAKKKMFEKVPLVFFPRYCRSISLCNLKAGEEAHAKYNQYQFLFTSIVIVNKTAPLF